MVRLLNNSKPSYTADQYEAKKSTVLIGTSGWEYSDWKGVFYPENLAKNKHLEYYSSIFETVEVNATFYRFFSEKTYKKWFSRVPNSFLYILKAPSLITHKKYLNECGSIIKNFSQTTETSLGEKLALILMQLSPKMPYNLELLEQALCSFEDPKKIVVEFRHPQWHTPETQKLLKKLGAVFCDTDSPDTNLTGLITSSIGYIRLHGKNKWYNHHYTQKELKKVSTIVRQMQQKGAEKIYIFFNNTTHGFAVKNALALKTLLDGE